MARARFERYRQEAESFLSAGDLHRGYAKLLMADDFASEPSMVQTVQRLAAEFNDEGLTRLSKAEELLERGEYKEALVDLQRLTVLRKLEVAKAATRRIAEARRDPELRASLNEADAEAVFQKAEQLLWSGPRVPDDEECADQLCEECQLRAETEAFNAMVLTDSVHTEASDDSSSTQVSAAWLLTPEQRVEIFAILRDVGRRFPETRAALKAKWLLEALESDPVLVQSVEASERERTAQRMLQMAANYRANGRADDAESLLRQVIHEFPDSDAAAKAQALLEEIRDST